MTDGRRGPPSTQGLAVAGLLVITAVGQAHAQGAGKPPDLVSLGAPGPELKALDPLIGRIRVTRVSTFPGKAEMLADEMTCDRIEP